MLKLFKLRVKPSWAELWGVSEEFLLRSWQVPNAFLTSSWWVPDEFLTSSWWVPDEFLTSSWQVSDQFLTSSSQVPDQFPDKFPDEFRTSLHLLALFCIFCTNLTFQCTLQLLIWDFFSLFSRTHQPLTHNMPNIEQKGIFWAGLAGRAADVWPANYIPFCSIFTYFQYSLTHDLAQHAWIA